VEAVEICTRKKKFEDVAETGKVHIRMEKNGNRIKKLCVGGNG
jgi:hypothetical protein